MDDRVELLGETSFEIVALEFSLWPVDHANGPFEPWLRQYVVDGGVSRGHPELSEADRVEKCLIAAGTSGEEVLPLGWSVPV